jgi:hypothetical protein
MIRFCARLSMITTLQNNLTVIRLSGAANAQIA